MTSEHQFSGDPSCWDGGTQNSHIFNFIAPYICKNLRSGVTEAWFPVLYTHNQGKYTLSVFKCACLWPYCATNVIAGMGAAVDWLLAGMRQSL
jgi:hypothetical protein